MRVGAQELGKDIRGMSISGSLISLANSIVSRMTGGLFQDIGVKDLAYIVAYLYHGGFLFADLEYNERDRQIVDNVKRDLLLVNTIDDFSQVLTNYTLSVISPLLYTRLLVDLEDMAGRLCAGSVFGMLYELTVKSESVYGNGYDCMHYSYKYRLGDIEVDLRHRGLLLEAATGHKKNKEHSVDKVMVGHEMIRVLTDEPGVWKEYGAYYRIGYPKALLMLSNGTIYGLREASL